MSARRASNKRRLCCRHHETNWRRSNAYASGVKPGIRKKPASANGPWRGLDDVEFATLGYVDWFNHRRLHGEILAGPGYTTPAAFEAEHYRQPVAATEAATQ